MSKSVEGKPSSSPGSASTRQPENNAAVQAIERSLQAGNFAEVRALAKQARSSGNPVLQAAADKAMALVRIEPTQLLIGVGALLIVVIVALLTLHHG